jgi:hypothetical protein
MMTLPLNLFFNLSLTLSSRTSIPEWEGSAQNKTSQIGSRTLFCPKLNGFRFVDLGECFLQISLFVMFSPRQPERVRKNRRTSPRLVKNIGWNPAMIAHSGRKMSMEYGQ